MSKMTPNELIDALTHQFTIEISICEIFQNRWSHIASSNHFFCGNHRLELPPHYGIMIHCDNETFQEVETYLLKIELIA